MEKNKIDDITNPFKTMVDLSKPKPFKIAFPILLDGDLVLSPEHLGPAYLMAVLRGAGADCQLFEIALSENLDDSIQQLVAWNPAVVGLSLTTINIKLAKKFALKINEYLPDSYFLVGGPLATHHGRKMFDLEGWEFIDGLIRGEAEVPILRFAEAYHEHQNYNLVPNLIYRDGLEIKETQLIAGISDLDLLPNPVRDQCEIHNAKLPYLRVSTSRGCTSHCTFCNAPHVKNRVGPPIKGWRGQSPSRVVDEVEELYYKYKINTFDFVDSTYEDPGGKAKAKARIRDIAEEILNRNLHVFYNVCMQAYNWHEKDRDLLKTLWQSGLEKVLIGVESGSQQGLARWDKRSTVADNVRTINLLSEQNIYVAFGFISFHPWSNFEEIRENYNFLKNYMGHNLRRFTTRLELYPGAEVVEQLREASLLLDDYDNSLNPFAYSYTDKRIEKLAYSLNALYGEGYAEDCTIDKEPSAFKMDTFDIILHNYHSRLLRYYHNNSTACEILGTFKHNIENIKQRLADFNYELLMGFTILAEKDEISSSVVAKAAVDVESKYQDAIKSMQTFQLKTSRALYKANCNIREIQGIREESIA